LAAEKVRTAQYVVQEKRGKETQKVTGRRRTVQHKGKNRRKSGHSRAKSQGERKGSQRKVNQETTEWKGFKVGRGKQKTKEKDVVGELSERVKRSNGSKRRKERTSQRFGIY